MIAEFVNPSPAGAPPTAAPGLEHLPDASHWAIRLTEKLQHLLQTTTPSLGQLEQLIEAECKDLACGFLQSAAQAVATAQSLICPLCHKPLHVEAHHRERIVHSLFGPLCLTRAYGLCRRCQERFFPADAVLGLLDRAPHSPRVQEICALLALGGPFARAHKSLGRLTGLDLSLATLHREALRQGQRALQLREADVALTQRPGGVEALAQRAHPPTAPFTLVIEMDAWNIRERDDWGQTQALRKKGLEPARWHWVYTGTCFRLDQRGQTAGRRPVITERGYVATRLGLEAFRDQLYVETLQRGLLQAALVLVVADGAVWIWNLVADRFKNSVQYVDLYHVKEHLWAVAHDIFGPGTPEARGWVTPLLHYLDRRQDGALDVIAHWEGMSQVMHSLTSKQKESLDREIGYFNTHKDRMKYKEGKAAGHPVGSGACESTCDQYQCRFKRSGQFWTLAGDESLLALETLERNGRWQLLFPHSQ